MSVGFRKSLFGFNCEDVINYIEKSNKSFAAKQEELTRQAEAVSKELDLSKEGYMKLQAEKDIISKKLSEFTEKYDEIERLSENIGKLYLVAQANAQAIMANSEKNAELTNTEVSRNITALDEAHVSLTELKQRILSTSNDFAGEVDGLLRSLDDTREQIAANAAVNADYKKQFDEVYESVLNEKI